MHCEYLKTYKFFLDHKISSFNSYSSNLIYKVTRAALSSRVGMYGLWHFQNTSDVISRNPFACFKTVVLMKCEQMSHLTEVLVFVRFQMFSIFHIKKLCTSHCFHLTDCFDFWCPSCVYGLFLEITSFVSYSVTNSSCMLSSAVMSKRAQGYCNYNK
jgi:hypothetical protein